MYWDPVTDTAWTSYQVGSQWHEAFFENPDSLYLAAKMAQENGIGGVGVWALGMDGSHDQAMVSALDGNAPAQKDQLAGPSSTSTSPNPVELAPLKTTSPPAGGVGQQTTSTTSTTAPAAAAPPVTYTYAGNWLGTQTRVLPSAVPAGHRISEGSMITFTTADPSFSCLDNEAALDVYFFVSDPTDDYVIARKSSGDCANAAFVFVPPVPTAPSSTTTTTTTPPPTTQPTPPATGVVYSYAGTWQAAQTRVLPSADPGTQGTFIGTMTAFTTADPNLSCLDNEPSLQVYHYANNPADDFVVARKSSGDCADAAFVFVPSAG